jgi:curved DNA-binding protein CbpA
MVQRDYYAILGVRSDSSAEEISQAYRQLARQYHPDLHPNDPAAGEYIKFINEAYSVLSDPVRRYEHDLSVAASLAAVQQQPTGAPEGASQPWQTWDPSWPAPPAPYQPSAGINYNVKVSVEGAANEVAEEARQALRGLRDTLSRLSRNLGSR